MLRNIVIALIALTIVPSAFANSNRQIVSGPATAMFIVDRYSSQATFELFYRGYLLECDRAPEHRSSVTAHLIFHHDGTTTIFRRTMYNNCEPSFFTREAPTGYTRSLEFEPSERAFWTLLTRAVYTRINFQLAFEKNGEWDSDYGNNYEIRF